MHWALKAEETIYRNLKAGGRSVQAAPARFLPYDIVVDGWQVEIKTSRFNGHCWRFNLHRHGSLKESKTDFYILRLEGGPIGSYAMHLLYRAPLNKKTLTISLRSLLNGDAARAEDFKSFRNGNYVGPKPC